MNSPLVERRQKSNYFIRFIMPNYNTIQVISNKQHSPGQRQVLGLRSKKMPYNTNALQSNTLFVKAIKQEKAD